MARHWEEWVKKATMNGDDLRWSKVPNDLDLWCKDCKDYHPVTKDFDGFDLFITCECPVTGNKWRRELAP